MLFLPQVTAGFLLGMTAFVGVVGAQCPEFARPVQVGRLTDSKFVEISGLAASRAHPGVFYVHNDGGRDKVYAVDATGALLATLNLATSISDFEDISVGPGPLAGVSYVYAGDIGSNNAERNRIDVYRFVEPSRPYASGSTTLSEVVRIQLSYPDKKTYDAETLLIDRTSGDLLVVTKMEGSARVFSAPATALSSGTVIPLTLVAEVPFELVSGGDISPTGSEIILRREDAAMLWKRLPGETVGQALGRAGTIVPVVGPPSERNGEAVGFAADNSGYYTLSEGEDQALYFATRVASVPPQIAPLIRVSGGWVLRVTGCLGGQVTIEASDDLREWTLVGQVALSNGTGDFPVSAVPRQKFFRARY